MKGVFLADMHTHTPTVDFMRQKCKERKLKMIGHEWCETIAACICCPWELGTLDTSRTNYVLCAHFNPLGEENKMKQNTTLKRTTIKPPCECHLLKYGNR